jgi:copper(I)-binding protein
MPATISRRLALRTALATGAGLLLPPARACDFFSTRLRIYQIWARETTLSDGVAPIYMQFDEVIHGDRLIGIETPLAEGAEMVIGGVASRLGLAIPMGEVTLLEEGGNFVRLLGLKQSLELGREYPIKLIFEHGGVVIADLDISYPRRTAPG